MSTGTEKGIGESLPTLAESAGAPTGALGIPAFVWLSAQGVEVRFANGLAEPGGNGVDTTTRVLVGPGAGKSGLQVASAGEAIGVAWQEVTASGHGVIKLRKAFSARVRWLAPREAKGPRRSTTVPPFEDSASG